MSWLHLMMQDSLREWALPNEASIRAAYVFENATAPSEISTIVCSFAWVGGQVFGVCTTGAGSSRVLCPHPPTSCTEYSTQYRTRFTLGGSRLIDEL